MHLLRLPTFSFAALLLALAASGALAQSIHSIPGGAGAGSSTGSASVGQVRTDSRPLLAVLPFEGKKVDADEVAIISEALASDLMRTGRVRVMERGQMDKILKEQGLQSSGLCDGGECAVEMGRLLGIDQMVVGSVGQLGRTYIISARLVSVATGEVIRSSSRSQQGAIDRMLTELVPRVAQDLVGEAAPANAAAPAPEPASPPRTAAPAPQRQAAAAPGFRPFRLGVDASLLATGVSLGDSFWSASQGVSTEAEGGMGYSVNLVADLLLTPSFGLRASAGFASRAWSWTSTGEMINPDYPDVSTSVDIDVDGRVSYLDLALGLQARLGQHFALAGGYMFSRPLAGEMGMSGSIGGFEVSRNADVEAAGDDVGVDDLEDETEYLYPSHSLLLEAEVLFNENFSLLLGTRLSATGIATSIEPDELGEPSLVKMDEDENFAISDLSLGFRYRF